MRLRMCSTGILFLFGLVLPSSISAQKLEYKVVYPNGKTETFKVDTKTCQMVGWQKKVGFSFSFNILKKYQGEGGFNFSKEEIRQLDDLQTDFGLQIEALCKDWLIGVYKSREKLYDCRRGNVSNALSSLRQLKMPLEAVKNIQDAAAKKQAVTEVLQSYFSFTKGNFSKDCLVAHLQPDRKRLEFAKGQGQNSLVVSNVGAWSINWWAAEPPTSFEFRPSGVRPLAPSTNENLVVLRIVGSVDASRPLFFFIRDDLHEQERVEIVLLEEAAQYIHELREIVTAATSKAGSDVEAADLAFKSVKGFYPQSEEAVAYWVSGALLNISGRHKAALLSLEKAGKLEPELLKHPQFQLDRGTALFLAGNRQEGITIVTDVSGESWTEGKLSFRALSWTLLERMYRLNGEPAKADRYRQAFDGMVAADKPQYQQYRDLVFTARGPG